MEGILSNNIFHSITKFKISIRVKVRSSYIKKIDVSVLPPCFSISDLSRSRSIFCCMADIGICRVREFMKTIQTRFFCQSVYPQNVFQREVTIAKVPVPVMTAAARR